MTITSTHTQMSASERVNTFLKEDPKSIIEMVNEKVAEFYGYIKEVTAQMEKWYKIKATTSDTKQKENADLALSLLQDEKQGYEREIRRFRLLIAKKRADASEINIEAIKAIPIGSIMPSEPKHQTNARATYLCPLHNEKTPSFIWNKDKNTYKCFGCGDYGDIINLYGKMHNLKFKEVINRLSTVSQ